MNRLIITTLGFALLVISSNAQNVQFGASIKPPVNFMTPEAANLGKYGTFNINFSTGTPNIGIPVYEIKDKDINIPLSLSYDASGFIPNKQAGIVGLNWNLSMGGAITRQVKGVPDEKYNNAPNVDEQKQRNDKGYIYGIREGLSESCGTPTCIENLSFLATTWPNDDYPVSTGLAYEHNPDIFSFNFLGHSGTFVMGSDGTVKVAGNRRYKVDLAGLSYKNDIAQDISLLPQPTTPNNIAAFNNSMISQIVITADDGFKFYFGGKLNSVEISFSYPSNSDYQSENMARHVSPKSGVISAWYLVKVVKPDGGEILFDYGEYSADEIAVLQNLSNEFPAGIINHKRAEFLDVKLFWRDYKSAYNYSNGIGGGNHGGNFGYTLEKALIKQVYLKKIITPSSTATFYYSTKNETQKFYIGSYENSVNVNLRYYTKKLDKIRIEDNLGITMPDGEDGLGLMPLYECLFEYNYYGSATSGYRLFLKKVKFNGEHIHEFGYHEVSSLPHPLTPGIDKWGFYNAVTNNTKLIGLNGPLLGGEYETDFSATGQNRQPTTSAAVAQIGLLKTIIYPTGGTTQFDFEPHTYRKILKRKVNALSGNSVIPEWETMPSDQYAGGVRIKTITTLPGVTTHYKYNKDVEDDAAQPSTGLLTNYGIFRMYVDFGSGFFDEKIYDDNIAASTGYGESHISYSEVKETVGDGSAGFTRHFYTTHETNPDNYYLGASSIKYFPTLANITSYANQLKRISRYSSRSIERGKLKKVQVFNAARTLVSSTEYTYNTDVNRFNMRTPGYEMVHFNKMNQAAGWIFNSVQLYHYHDQPTQIVEKTYVNGQERIVTTNMVYKGNDNPLLLHKTVSQSDGSVVKTEYQYAEDMGFTGDYPTMVSKFMVGMPTIEKAYRNTTLQVTSETVYDDLFNNGTTIKPIRQQVTNHTVNPATTQTVLNLEYYSNGDLMKSYKQDDMKTIYMWDYAKQYPVAEIKNADNISDVAYTSFETTEKGNWTFNETGVSSDLLVPTGMSVFSLTGNTIQKTGLNTSKQYVVSLWFKGSSISCNSVSPVNEITVGTWIYKEYLVSSASTVTISGTGIVDELRCYPKGAFMSTYIYYPLFGIGAICDLNNQISYYEYDAMGRLAVIRDRNRSVRKKYCYNYAGQPENCDFTAANWQATGTTRCKPCEINPTYTYDIVQREEKDMNTSSPTYNQVQWVDQGRSKNCISGWTATGNLRCELDGNNQNTGFQEREEINMNPCSPSYNQLRWVNNGLNSNCPACTPANCTGNDRMCINGVCEIGTLVTVSGVLKKINNVWVWECTYRYCFSDGSLSTYSQIGYNSTGCPLACF